MSIFRRKPEHESDDPRDMVGDNPTGRERRSSAGTRRKAARKALREMEDDQ